MADEIDFVPESESTDTIDFQPESTAQPRINLTPYQKYALSGREPVAGPFGPASPEEVPALIEAAQRPFIPLPDTLRKGALPAFYRSVVKPVVEGIESPIGVLTAPILAQSAAARLAAGIGFGGLAAKSGLGKMQSADPQTQLEGRMELASAPLLALAGGGRDRTRIGIPESIKLPEPLPPVPKLTGEAREFQILRENWLPTIKDWRRQLLDKEVAKGEGTHNIETNFSDSPGARDVVRAKRYYELARKLFGRKENEEITPTEPTPKLPQEEISPTPEIVPQPTPVETPKSQTVIPEPIPEKPSVEQYVTPPVTEPPTISTYDAEIHDRAMANVNASLSGKKRPSRSELYQLYDQEYKRLKSTEPPTTSVEPGAGPEMGAMGIGERPPVGAGGEKYGVRAVTRAERAQAGQVEPVPPGTGTSPEAQVLKYRAMVQEDPTLGPRLLAEFEADPKKRISDELGGVTRAHGEALFAGARTIEEQFGTDSPQWREADRIANDWDQRTKPIQTEWSEIGRGQQGETDLDTGSFTGLNRAYRQVSKKDIPKPVKPKAEKIAADNKTAQGAVDEASRKLNKAIVEKATKDPDLAKVWQLAKQYLDENKGLYNFDDLRNKIAADLGMKPDEVTRILAKDKTTKRLADDLWNKQRNARRLKEQAKNWLRSLDTPFYQKALASIPNTMFSLSVFGHGFVALGTHAPIVAFQPRFWNAYVRNFGRMYKLVFSPAYYERQMQDLVRRPNYEVARRAGLQNDPFKYEEFHTTAIRDLVKNWVGEKNMGRVDKATSGGNRGYSVLKVLRQDMFDQAYSRLPRSIRVQEGVAAALADGINHATGVTAKAAPVGSNIALFAPRLAGSRVMWLGGDPIRAARIVANWKNATTADKVFATNQMKEKAWVFGTFAGLLAANQGFLAAAGSKQKINGVPEVLGGAGIDPMASDFLKFKALGGNIAYGGALLTLAKLPARVATAILYEGKGSKYILEDERVDKVIGQYIRSQMSPFAGTVSDLAIGRDYEERPLPAKMFGTAEQPGAVPKRLQNIGVDEPYNWPEYTMTKLPIPMAEAIKEGLRASGMAENQVNPWMKALAIGSIMTGTGTRITEDTREE